MEPLDQFNDRRGIMVSPYGITHQTTYERVYINAFRVCIGGA
jgi:hypothetical protein